MVEGGGLENRCARKGTGGSNPSSSATLKPIMSKDLMGFSVLGMRTPGGGREAKPTASLAERGVSKAKRQSLLLRHIVEFGYEHTIWLAMKRAESSASRRQFGHPLFLPVEFGYEHTVWLAMKRAEGSASRRQFGLPPFLSRVRIRTHYMASHEAR